MGFQSVAETRFTFGGVKLMPPVSNMNTMPLLPLSGHMSTLHHHWNYLSLIYHKRVYNCYKIDCVRCKIRVCKYSQLSRSIGNNRHDVIQNR